jgi:hypothetical protein
MASGAVSIRSEDVAEPRHRVVDRQEEEGRRRRFPLARFLKQSNRYGGGLILFVGWAAGGLGVEMVVGLRWPAR